MPDYKRGAKAGALSGFIFGIAIAIYFSSLSGYYNLITIIFSIFFVSLYLAIPGMGFGLLFVKFYDRLPADSSLSKSIILSVYSWVALFLFFAFSSSSSKSYMLYVYPPVVNMLIVFVLFGICFAFIFEKIKSTAVLRERNIKRCPNCGRIIKEDYKKCPYCCFTL